MARRRREGAPRQARAGAGTLASPRPTRRARVHLSFQRPPVVPVSYPSFLQPIQHSCTPLAIPAPDPSFPCPIRHSRARSIIPCPIHHSPARSVIPMPDPSFPCPIRHSRESGNPFLQRILPISSSGTGVHDLAHELAARIFERINAILAECGSMLGTGTVVDATLIAPSSTKNSGGQRDPEMHQTKKGKQWFSR